MLRTVRAPHFAFHASNLRMFDTGDKFGTVTVLAGTIVLAALLLIPTRTVNPLGDLFGESAC
ncbi:hypothetical protein ABH926_005353 [Catenulispora sp. GP43]